MNFLARIFGKRAPLDLNAPDVARDPYPHYEALRRTGSVHFLPHHDAWIVLGYDDVQSVFARPASFSNRAYRDVDAVLLGADPPEHTAMRRIVGRYFTADALEHLAAFAEARALALLQPRMDVVRDYARALSESVAAELLGFAASDIDGIHAAQSQAQSFIGFTHALDALADRATMLARLRADGLADADARSIVRLMWLAATATTERVIAHAVLRLLRHDPIRRAVTDDAARIPAFIDEVLRLHVPELLIRRVATEDVTLGGANIPRGAMIYLSLAAANRDPAKFDDAATPRLDRPPVRPLSFGYGIHHCIGALLARREVTTAVRTLLAQAPRFRAAQPLDAIAYSSGMAEHAIASLIIDTNTELA
jgi:cytochrome P450